VIRQGVVGPGRAPGQQGGVIQGEPVDAATDGRVVPQALGQGHHPVVVDDVIGVAEQQQFAAARPAAHVASVARAVRTRGVDHAQVRHASAPGVGQRGGPVVGAVIDNDHLPPPLIALATEGIELGTNRRHSVAGGDDHADPRAGRRCSVARRLVRCTGCHHGQSTR
jgi:hypothetical protein